MIKLIVGLGNPGDKYQFNRHNVGFWLVDALANTYNGVWKNERKFYAQTCKITIDDIEVILLKPLTFMNSSGKSVSAIISFFKLLSSQILVVHDELDFPIHNIKFKTGGGHGGHNGLRDIINHIGKDFHRLRIGIGRPQKSQVVDFVLKNPSKQEQEIILHNIVNFLQLAYEFIQGDFDKAAQKLHIKMTL